MAKSSYSYDFIVDGIYYGYDSYSGSAYVTNGDSKYEGNIIIPGSITYNGRTLDVKRVGQKAFSDCTELVSIKLPSSVTDIGQSAFANCRKLESIDFQGVKAIRESAFIYCSSLKSIVFPEGLETISNDSFRGCGSLSEIKFPQSLTSIGEYAFSDCGKNEIEKLLIPKGVKSIGRFAFSFIQVKELVFEDGEGEIECDGHSYGSSSWIPARFSGASIKKIYFGRSVSLIEWQRESTEEVTIGEKATFVGFGLEYCTNVKVVNAMSTSSNLNYIAFSSTIYSNAVLYVPKGMADTYRNAGGWRNFFNIQEKNISDMWNGMNNPNDNPDDPQQDSGIFLTLQYADNGSIMERVNTGYSYKYKICPSDGWKINTVTFNGNDVTEQLDVDKTFTTPIITNNSVLNVSFEKIGESAIRNMEQGSMKVYATGNVMYIRNIPINESLSIFDVSGKLYCKTPVGKTEFNTILPTGNIYIVKGEYYTVKIKL